LSYGTTADPPPGAPTPAAV